MTGPRALGFSFDGKQLEGFEGERWPSALLAEGRQGLIGAVVQISRPLALLSGVRR